MCRAVAEAMATGTHLVVQAGTGTGKSLAYLVPAALERQEGRRRHGDQGAAGPAGREGPAAGRGRSRAAGAARLRRPEGAEQLRLPPAGGRGGLGWDPGRAGRPGAGRADEPDRDRRSTRPRPPDASGGSRRPRAWSRRCASWWRGRRRRRRGDRADLSFEPSDRAWNMVSVGPRECPGAYNCPSGGQLLRRGRPRTGGGGRRRGGQHPPLRRAPGQRRRRAARARRGHLRRGPRARGGHDVEPRGRGDARALPLARDVGPLAGRAAATPSCSTRWPRSATSSARCSADRVGTRVLHDEARPPVDDRELAELLARAAEVGRRRHRRAAPGRRAALLPRRGRRVRRPTPTGPAARPARCRRPRTWPRTCTASSRAATARWPGSTAPGATSGCASPPSTSAPCSPAMLWGEVTSVLTSATIPPRIVERVGLRGLPHRGAQRRQPVRLPLPRAALRRPPPARPPGGRGPRRRSTRSSPS